MKIIDAPISLRDLKVMAESRFGNLIKAVVDVERKIMALDYPKDMLKVAGAKVVAGGVLNDPFTDLVAYKKYRSEIQFLVVPGFGKVEHEFLVEGRGSITISYDSRHAGKLTKTVKLD